jgi:single-strand DNA-binding protein
MSNVTITGLVATTPRYILTIEEVPIISFRLASEENSNGVINWYTITAFNKLAENVRDSVDKGHRVIVSGEMNIRDWDNGERTGTSVEVISNSVGHDLNYGTTEFTRISLVEKDKRKEMKTKLNTVIKIQGQDNNVSDVITAIERKESSFMKEQQLEYLGAEMYGLGDNPRWFGVDIQVSGEPLDNKVLDSFRAEFPNVDAEVSE